ncbi:Galectin-3 [Chelonia mydas]|uniref:Galectin n=1 Tax=Chelonia mydas TaxID=8469 RepID=M7B6Q5_CHEMY|nr:Galectin-3 [Chelonia mydas]
MNEIAFHFKTLFKEDRARAVFNSKLNNEWGQGEERCFSPFYKGKNFQLQFVITKNGYKDQQGNAAELQKILTVTLARGSNWNPGPE